MFYYTTFVSYLDHSRPPLTFSAMCSTHLIPGSGIFCQSPSYATGFTCINDRCFHCEMCLSSSPCDFPLDWDNNVSLLGLELIDSVVIVSNVVADIEESQQVVCDSSSVELFELGCFALVNWDMWKWIRSGRHGKNSSCLDWRCLLVVMVKQTFPLAGIGFLNCHCCWQFRLFVKLKS